MTAICSKPNCTSPVQSRGYCESHYRYRLHIGIYGHKDAGEVRKHIAKLRELGWTWKAIGEAAGLSHSIPYHLMNGRKFRCVLPETGAALLSVPAVPAASQRGVDSTGSRRRVQALAWMGWSCAEIARRLGTSKGSLSTLIQPNRRISYAYALKLVAIYDELCHQPGPSPMAARQARVLGFAPPAAWDNIDDPRERPKGVRKTPVAREVA